MLRRVKGARLGPVRGRRLARLQHPHPVQQRPQPLRPGTQAHITKRQLTRAAHAAAEREGGVAVKGRWAWDLGGIENPSPSRHRPAVPTPPATVILLSPTNASHLQLVLAIG